MVRSTIPKLDKREIKAIEEFAAATKSAREHKRAQAVLYKARRGDFGESGPAPLHKLENRSEMLSSIRKVTE